MADKERFQRTKFNYKKMNYNKYTLANCAKLLIIKYSDKYDKLYI